MIIAKIVLTFCNRKQAMIQTRRLNILPLTLTDLKTVLGSSAALEERLSLQLVPDLLAGRAREAVVKKISKMENAPIQYHPWYTYWLIIIRNIPVGAGMVGFKGSPDENGSVEIGYGIDPEYQRAGYMTEAVKGMVAWAFTDPSCKIITATLTAPDNIASHRVLEKVGMQQDYSGEDGVSFHMEKPKQSR